MTLLFSSHNPAPHFPPKMKDHSPKPIWSESFASLVSLEEALPSQFPSSQSSAMQSPLLANDKPTVPSMNSRLHRSSPESIAALRSLPSTAIIVLFTPVLSFDVKSDGAAGDRTDPFESLGKALSHHHKRIRHVPYVPKAGMTPTHVAFLRHASAIVTVVCMPPGASSTKSDASLKSQISFSGEVAAALKKMHSEVNHVPCAMVCIGTDLLNDSDRYQTLICSGTTNDDALQQAADLLFSCTA